MRRKMLEWRDRSVSSRGQKEGTFEMMANKQVFGRWAKDQRRDKSTLQRAAITMFSWSKPSSVPPSAASSTAGRRPPSGIGRDAHLSSYLNHPVLKPSTRKVSIGENRSHVCTLSPVLLFAIWF